jgi:hypothetical protein
MQGSEKTAMSPGQEQGQNVLRIEPVVRMHSYEWNFAMLLKVDSLKRILALNSRIVKDFRDQTFITYSIRCISIEWPRTQCYCATANAAAA